MYLFHTLSHLCHPVSLVQLCFKSVKVYSIIFLLISWIICFTEPFHDICSWSNTETTCHRCNKKQCITTRRIASYILTIFLPLLLTVIYAHREQIRLRLRYWYTSTWQVSEKPKVNTITVSDFQHWKTIEPTCLTPYPLKSNQRNVYKAYINCFLAI